MTSLAGKRILIVEDEALIAAMVEDMLIDLGAVPVGPARTIQRGLGLVASEALDAAILDVNVRDERIDPVADALRERGIPMLFASGYGARGLVDRPGAVVIDKPFSRETLENALTGLLREP